MSRPKNTLVIGIDFGTTFSGAAWALSSKPDRIQVITTWSCRDGGIAARQKTPTTILYSGNSPGGVDWGYDVPSDQDPIKWFKLLLLTDEELSKELRPNKLQAVNKLKDTRRRIQALSKTPVQVIADYLRCAWDHIMHEVESSTDKLLLRHHVLHVVLTVPAIWKNPARDKMQEAAKLAGILEARPAGETQLSLVSEPEAAAFATIQDNTGFIDLNVGDTFVVCDAGGGTVDVISYKVTGGGKDIPMEECVEGHGALAGAAILDEEFEKLMRRKIPQDVWRLADAKDIREMFKLSWEQGIKQQYKGTAEDWEVRNLPWKWCEKLQSSSVIVESGLIQEAFDFVITKIENVVGKQYQGVQDKTGKKPKYLILVGGFGRCPYLKSRLEDELPEETRIIQSQGELPWTAICRGAVMKGLGRDVGSRISKANYGVSYDTFYNSSVHLEQERYRNPVTKLWMARNQMQWFLRRGETTGNRAPKRIPYVIPLLKDVAPPSYPHFEISLFTSEKIDATARKDESVTYLNTVTSRSTIPFERLPVRNVRGSTEEYRELPFDLEMTSQGASVEFAVYMSGQRLASQTVVVQLEDKNSRVNGAPSIAVSAGNQSSGRLLSGFGNLPIRPRTSAPDLGYTMPPSTIGEYGAPDVAGHRGAVSNQGAHSANQSLWPGVQTTGRNSPLPSSQAPAGQDLRAPQLAVRPSRSLRSLFSSKNKQE